MKTIWLSSKDYLLERAIEFGSLQLNTRRFRFVNYPMGGMMAYEHSSFVIGVSGSGEYFTERFAARPIDRSNNKTRYSLFVDDSQAWGFQKIDDQSEFPCYLINDEEGCWRTAFDEILDLERASIRWAGFHQCESPIEQAFYGELLLTDDRPLEAAPVAQFQIGRYRLDIAFPRLKACVELDGHEFHKTKEQRTHDASRERWLQLNGWRVIRFTGSEIHRDVKACVRQTIDFIAKVKEQHGCSVLAT